MGSLPVILIACMIFQSPFADVISMSMSTVSFTTRLTVSLLAEFFPLHMILMALSLYL